MKKLKILSFLSFIFGIMFFTNIAPVKAEDIHLYGFEDVYGWENVSFKYNQLYADDNYNYDCVGSTIDIHYQTGFQLNKSDKIYLLLNDTVDANHKLTANSEDFSVVFNFRDLNGDLYTFGKNDIYHSSVSAMHYDEEGIIQYAVKEDRKGFYLNDYGYSIKNEFFSGEYWYYDDTTGSESLGSYYYNFTGNLYEVNFSTMPIDDFILDSVDFRFNWDFAKEYDYFNSSYLQDPNGCFYELFNMIYDFEILLDEAYLTQPSQLSKIEQYNDTMSFSFTNVQSNFAPSKVILTSDSKGKVEYSLNKVSTSLLSLEEDSSNQTYVVNDLSLSENGTSSYKVDGFVFSDLDGNLLFRFDDTILQYNEEVAIHQCYIPSLAQRYYTGALFAKNYYSYIYFNLYDIDLKQKITDLEKVKLKYSYDSGLKTIDTYYTWYNSTSISSVSSHDAVYNCDGEVVKSSSEEGFKINFQAYESKFWDNLLKNMAGAESYSYWNFAFRTSRKIHENDDKSLAYDLGWAVYRTKEGTLTGGSTYPNALWVDENNNVRTGAGVIVEELTFDGMNIVNVETGEIKEPSNQYKARTATSDDNVLIDIKDAVEDTGDNYKVLIEKMIATIKEFFNKIGIVAKVAIGIFVSLFLFFIVYKVVKLIVKIFKK